MEKTKKNQDIWLKFILMVAIGINISFVFYSYFYYDQFDYLPSPFYYDKSDTFADLLKPYNIVKGEASLDVRDHYPYAAYLLLSPAVYLEKLIDITPDRACIALYGVYLVVFILTFGYSLWRVRLYAGGLVNMAFLFIFCISSFPFLYTIERGNLIIVTVLLLTVSTLMRKMSFGVFYIFMSGLIKPYVYMLIIAYKKIFSLRGAVWYISVTMIIAEIGYYTLGPRGLLVKNMFEFLLRPIGSVREALSLQYSPSYIYGLLSDPLGRGEQFMPFSVSSDYGLIIYSLLAIPLMCATFIVNKFPPSNRLTIDQALLLLALGLVFFTHKIGGYAILLTVPFCYIFFVSKKLFLERIIFVLVFLPVELLFVIKSDVLHNMHLYSSGMNANVLWQFSIWQIVRPILFMLLCGLMLYKYRSVKEELTAIYFKTNNKIQ